MSARFDPRRCSGLPTSHVYRPAYAATKHPKAQLADRAALAANVLRRFVDGQQPRDISQALSIGVGAVLCFLREGIQAKPAEQRVPSLARRADIARRLFAGGHTIEGIASRLCMAVPLVREAVEHNSSINQR